MVREPDKQGRARNHDSVIKKKYKELTLCVKIWGKSVPGKRNEYTYADKEAIWRISETVGV